MSLGRRFELSKWLGDVHDYAYLLKTIAKSRLSKKNDGRNFEKWDSREIKLLETTDEVKDEESTSTSTGSSGTI